MNFDLEKFVASPTQEELISLKKDELLLLAGHYQLKDCKRSMRKADIYGNILRYFVEHGILEDRVLEISQEKGVESSFSEQVELRKLEMDFELRKMERELEERQKERELEERQKERELEERKMEREERQKDKELELRKMELEHKIGLAASQPTFDVSKHIRFVPPFQEKEVDIFFCILKKLPKI